MREASTCHALPLRPGNSIFITSLTAIDAHTWLALCSDDAPTLFTPEAITWTLHASHTTTRATLFKPPTHQLLTAGDDARIKIWDTRTTPPNTPLHTLPCSAPILSLASHADSSIIAAGTELSNHSATLSFFDLRFLSPTPLQRYAEVHSDDIVSLAYATPTCLVSGSADGLVNMYDTRISDEDDALQRVWNVGAGVSRVGFLDGGEKVWGLSCDEKLAVYEPADVDVDGQEWVFGDVRPVLGCDYVVDVLDAKAGGGGGGGVVGAGYFGQSRLDLVPLRQTPVWQFLAEDAIRLGTGLGEEIVRCVVVDDANERVLTGSEDHMVRIWGGFV